MLRVQGALTVGASTIRLLFGSCYVLCVPPRLRVMNLVSAAGPYGESPIGNCGKMQRSLSSASRAGSSLKFPDTYHKLGCFALGES